jgi:hypothetical protein
MNTDQLKNTAGAEYKMNETEKLYKLYNIKDRKDYEGATVKCECTINGEYGLFKERISLQSKDNVMEEVVSRLAQLVGVPCAFASCRKHKDIIGSFSRYEIPVGYDFVHLEDILHISEININGLMETVLRLSHGKITDTVITIYKYIILDYIVGQRDRHLCNIAAINKRGTKSSRLYPLYDNGLCCFSTDSNDIAIKELNNRFYSSRIGSNEDIIRGIQYYRNYIHPGDLREIVQYDKINTKVLQYYIDKADKYKQIGKERREATVRFIMRNTVDIHKINTNTFDIGGLYV